MLHSQRFFQRVAKVKQLFNFGTQRLFENDKKRIDSGSERGTFR